MWTRPAVVGRVRAGDGVGRRAKRSRKRSPRRAQPTRSSPPPDVAPRTTTCLDCRLRHRRHTQETQPGVLPTATPWASTSSRAMLARGAEARRRPWDCTNVSFETGRPRRSIRSPNAVFDPRDPAGFGVMFLSPTRWRRSPNLARATAPGGRLTLVVWQGRSRTTSGSWFRRAALALGRDPPRPSPKTVPGSVRVGRSRSGPFGSSARRAGSDVEARRRALRPTTTESNPPPPRSTRARSACFRVLLEGSRRRNRRRARWDALTVRDDRAPRRQPAACKLDSRIWVVRGPYGRRGNEGGLDQSQ